jgi:hypothetical protein
MQSFITPLFSSVSLSKGDHSHSTRLEDNHITVTSGARECKNLWRHHSALRNVTARLRVWRKLKCIWSCWEGRLWRILSSEIWRPVVSYKFRDVSEKRTACFFLITHLAYALIPKMIEIISLETLHFVTLRKLRRTSAHTWHHPYEDVCGSGNIAPHIYLCTNFRAHAVA